MVGSLKSSEFNREIAEIIIQRGSMDLWKAHDEKQLGAGLQACLLHLAVRNKRPRFVQLFVKNYPWSVTTKWAYSDGSGERYPLWYNNHNEKGVRYKGSPDKDRAEIRTEITTKMIEEESEMEALFDMFSSCAEPVGDLCFDLSRFDSAGFQVSTFIDSMMSQPRTKELLKYEKTLRYVEFPPLDALKDKRESFEDSCYLQEEHDEVFRILDWLKREWGVETIIKLKVPDRLVNSHDEDMMASRVDEFKVHILDWKVLDLCLDTLCTKAKERITELHLYSSGKRSVISHWFSTGGLPSMKKLKRLRINLVQETCTSDHLWKLKEDIEQRFVHLCELMKDSEETSVPENQENDYMKDLQVDQIAWYPKAQQANLMKIAQRIDPKLGRWLENLNKYFQHEGPEEKDFTRVKVAILDDGVLSVSPKSKMTMVPVDSYRGASNGVTNANGMVKTRRPFDTQSTAAAQQVSLEDSNSLSNRIKAGRSFVAGGSSHSPWHLACNPHGTQMANLICAMDPLCEIYIARVAEDAVGITPERVVKAIDWAIEMGVDIISMSFTIAQPGHLAEAIMKATREGIVMTCSTHDEGSKTEKAWPASFGGDEKSLIVLAACDKDGRTLRNIEDSAYNFLLPGQEVSAGNIPFLKSDEKISGSSVATALAAGICSLTLTCDRLANAAPTYTSGVEEGSRYKLVTEQLKKMQSEVGSMPIVLNKFGGINAASGGATGNPKAYDIIKGFHRRI